MSTPVSEVSATSFTASTSASDICVFDVVRRPSRFDNEHQGIMPHGLEFPLKFNFRLPVVGGQTMIHVPLDRPTNRSATASATPPVRTLAVAAGAARRQTPAWMDAVRQELLALLTLQPGWDSYSAQPINGAAIGRVGALLNATTQADTPRPAIVPMSRGGLQLEWHLRNLNIEVTIPPDGLSVEVWYEDLANRTEHEFSVEAEPQALRDLLALLTNRR